MAVQTKKLQAQTLLFESWYASVENLKLIQRLDRYWVITNHPSLTTTPLAKEVNKVRWQVEQFHHELKQLIGSEKCQSRNERAQRTHLGLCYQAWLAIKVAAHNEGKSAYRIVKELIDDWLRAELREPHILALTTS